MSTRATRMRMKTTRMRRTMMMTRGEDDKDHKDTGQGRGTRMWTMRDNRQQGGMSTRETRMRMKTTRMRRTRMRTRGEDKKEDKVEEQQGGQWTTTRTQDKDVDNEGLRDEYKDCKL